MTVTETFCCGESIAQRLHQFLFILNGPHPALANSVDRKGCLERREYVRVINDKPAVLVVEDTICAGNGLHECMIPPRFIKIYNRAAWRIESGEPHRTEEDDPQRVL